MFTKSWKVYSLNNVYDYRQFLQQRESIINDNGLSLLCTDLTHTKEYVILTLTRPTESECDEEMEAQVTDGIFENYIIDKAENICCDKIEPCDTPAWLLIWHNRDEIVVRAKERYLDDCFDNAESQSFFGTYISDNGEVNIEGRGYLCIEPRSDEEIIRDDYLIESWADDDDFRVWCDEHEIAEDDDETECVWDYKGKSYDDSPDEILKNARQQLIDNFDENLGKDVEDRYYDEIDQTIYKLKNGEDLDFL